MREESEVQLPEKEETGQEKIEVNAKNIKDSALYMNNVKEVIIKSFDYIYTTTSNLVSKVPDINDYIILKKGNIITTEDIENNEGRVVVISGEIVAYSVFYHCNREYENAFKNCFSLSSVSSLGNNFFTSYLSQSLCAKEMHLEIANSSACAGA